MNRRVSGETLWRRYPKRYTVASPAAGSDWSVTVPSGTVWDLRSVLASLVTAVAAATRDVRLQVSDGNVTYLDIPSNTTQLASLTRLYLWAPLSAAYAAGGGIVNPIPDLRLEEGTIIRTLTDSVQAADQWSGIVLDVFESQVTYGGIDLRTLPDLVVELTGQGAG